MNEKEILNVLFWEFPPEILEYHIKTFEQLEDKLERLVERTGKNSHKRRKLSEKLTYCRAMRQAAIEAKKQQENGQFG